MQEDSRRGRRREADAPQASEGEENPPVSEGPYNVEFNLSRVLAGPMTACRMRARLLVHLHSSRFTRASSPALPVGLERLVAGFEEAKRGRTRWPSGSGSAKARTDALLPLSMHRSSGGSRRSGESR
jgi:hypothetical protein